MKKLGVHTKDNMTLYDFHLSGNCHKVRLMLSLLKLPYETIHVDMAGGGHKSPAFLALNPRGQVPVLRDGDTVVWDSMAILAYLATKYGPQYLPTDPVNLARTLQWLAVSENEILYGLAKARAYFRFQRLSIPLQEVQALGIAGLNVLEASLAEMSWLIGDRLTIADIACYPYIRLAEEGNVSLSEFPAIRDWLARIESLPGFVPMPGGGEADKMTIASEAA